MPSVFERMTDSSGYTGAHRERFDKDGKGRGLAGRDSGAEATSDLSLMMRSQGSQRVKEASKKTTTKVRNRPSSARPASARAASSRPASAARKAPAPKTSETQRIRVKSMGKVSGEITLDQVFDMYASFGKRDATELDNAKFSKMCRECKIMTKGVSTGNVDIAFEKAKTKGKRTLSFEQFEDALAILGPQRFPKDPDPEQKIIRCVLHHASNGPLIRTAVKPVEGEDDVVQRMTDTTHYTGAHKERFDDSGRGKGLKGRDSVSKSKGAKGGDLAALTRPGLRTGEQTSLDVSTKTSAMDAGLADDEILALFDQFDEDKSGFLDLDEVGWLCEDMGLVLTDEQVEEALSEMEGGRPSRRDGEVDCEEFVRWWRADSKSKKAGSLARRMCDARESLIEAEMTADTPMGRMLAAKQGAAAAAPKPKAKKKSGGGGDVLSRLTDTSKYTGAHGSRFDDSGRGKGLDGRDSASGMVRGGNVSDLSQITRR